MFFLLNLKAINDLLVTQKQITVGNPYNSSEIIISCQKPAFELIEIIYKAHNYDFICASITQEIIVYLSMLIKTEPSLFNEMFRLRIGLIMEIMSSEFTRISSKSDDDGIKSFIDLSPHCIKTLLYHILSGKEFTVIKGDFNQISAVSNPSSFNRLKKAIKASNHSLFRSTCEDYGDSSLSSSELISNKRTFSKISSVNDPMKVDSDDDNLMIYHNDSFTANDLSKDSFVDSEEFLDCETSLNSNSNDRFGLWLRRRFLDGTLNRVPINFYHSVWLILERFDGIKIGDTYISHVIIQEMTAGELKFALFVESVLNKIVCPAIRQMIVEVLMLVSIMISNSILMDQFVPDNNLCITSIINKANDIFLEFQSSINGPSINCCSNRPYNQRICVAYSGICKWFLDSAPSGNYGTLLYFTKALLKTLHCRSNTTDPCRVN